MFALKNDEEKKLNCHGLALNRTECMRDEEGEWKATGDEESIYNQHRL